MASSRGRRRDVGRQWLRPADGIRCGQLFSRSLDCRVCHHKREYSSSTPQKIVTSSPPGERDDQETLQVTTDNDDTGDFFAIEAENCQDSGDVLQEEAEEEEEEDDDKDDEDGRLKRQMLEKLACPRHRRKTLTGWVTRRCSEICNEDADEPDSEDEEIRSALMDALGAASENVEADLANGYLNLSADDFGTLDLLAWTLEPLLGYTSEQSPQSPKIRFAGSSVTFFIKPEMETTIALVSTTSNTSWMLDSVQETPLLGNVGTPLGKWREKK